MSHERKLIEDLTVVRPKPLSFAVTALIAAPAATAVAQEQQEASENTMLEEVTVTARKRAENLQMVPESIQAISDQTIEQAGIRGMDDYVRFIPSLNVVQANPGTAMVVFRGIADAQSTFIAEPSAAVYLDEQSLVLNGQPNPRMIDIERVEALSGPQGTLYGASAQAGVLRIVTNKPDPTAFDAFVDVDISDTKNGDISYDVSGMVNIPLSDSWALRLVGFTAKDGGFIDVVQGTSVPYGLYDNSDVVQDDFNEVDYTGGRISARWFINDNWTMTAGIIYQKTESDGRNEHDPAFAGDLAVVRLNPDFEYDRQDWTQYALTFEGDLGFADFVSATSYFTRDWEYTQDTSVGYAAYFGTFCYIPYPGYNWIAYTRYCFFSNDLRDNDYLGVYYNDMRGYLRNDAKNWKFSQEFRMFHQGDTIDWVAGFFYEKSHEEWVFDTFADGYDQSRSFQNYLDGNLAWRGNPIPTGLSGDQWWRSADDTDWEQYAVFGELTWHLTDSIDVTAGYRWFKRTMDKIYYVELPANNITDEGISTPSSNEKDGVPKFSVSWNITDDNMIYGLYSEGFRPGGTNRGRGQPFFPQQYDSDKLENIEFGTKNTLFNGRMRLNLTYFDMSWNDYQLEVVDPASRPCGNENAPPEPLCGQPWQKVVANVGNASSKGVEMQWDWQASDMLTIGANATWLDAKVNQDVPDLGVPAGSRLPLSPEFKGSAYAQLDWPVDWFGANSAWLRLQWSYTGDMLNQVEALTLDDGPSPQIKQPSYDIGDLRFGVDATNWSMQLYVNNLTDERAVLFANPYEFDYFFGRSRVTVNRPREIGIRWIQRFGQ
jgi:outer membrane receptor protein involved in Fe transport